MRKIAIAVIVSLCAILAVGCAKPPTATQTLRKSASVYYKAKSLKIEAENSRKLQVNQQWQETGQLLQTEVEKPSKLRQQVVGGKMPSVVSDGTKAYFYVDQMKSYMEIPAERLIPGISRDPSSGPILRFMNDKEPLKDIEGAKMAGDEKLGEVDCYVVQFTPTEPIRGLEKAKLTEKVWIGKEDSLVRKSQLVATEERPEQGEKHKAVMTMTTTVTKQDLDVTIPASEYALPKGAKSEKMPAMPTHP